MKALIWYCKKLEIGNCKLNGSNVSMDVLNSTKKIKEKKVLCPWITVEGKEDVNYFDAFGKDLREMADHFKTNNVIIMPFVHLAYNIPPYEFSFEILMKLKDYLESKKYSVKIAHFGSSKDFKFFSPADEMQVVMRQYPNPQNTIAKKEEKKESIWFNNKAKAVKKTKGKGTKQKPKKEKQIKLKKSQNKSKQKKSMSFFVPIKAEKKPTNKEWVSSLYNLAPSTRKK
ncbi:MAG: threonyl-tRNA synthetase editing domain-containing protein [Candidatus ainarchaeum sp.]|nr:threonyl-tRNA synthetase editing domain-containing protein [Candidatus ainarchaeum sp.]